MFVPCCGITATLAGQTRLWREALGSPPRTNTLSGPHPISPTPSPCWPERCCRRNSLHKQSWQYSQWGSHKFKKGERRREQQGGKVGKRRKLSVVMRQEKLFGLRGRLKLCRVITFGSILSHFFDIKFVFDEMGVSSSPWGHLKTGVRKAK